MAGIFPSGLQPQRYSPGKPQPYSTTPDPYSTTPDLRYFSTPMPPTGYPRFDDTMPVPPTGYPRPGYMPGAPAGFIMNPFLYTPPTVTPPPPPAPPKPVPEVPYTESGSEDQGSSFSGLGYENDQRAEFGTFGDAFSTLTPSLYEALTGSQAWGYVPGADGGEGSWHHGGLPAGVDPSQQQSAAMYGGGGSRDVNLKDIASIGLSLAAGGPFSGLYTAADKLLFGDKLPGVTDVLGGVGNVIQGIGSAVGGLFGLNTQPVTTSSSTSTGWSVVPLPPPPFVAAEQYDGYGTSYEEPYTGWLDPTDYGYQTDELTWSPSEDVSSWSEDLAQAAEDEQWGG